MKLQGINFFGEKFRDGKNGVKIYIPTTETDMKLLSRSIYGRRGLGGRYAMRAMPQLAKQAEEVFFLNLDKKN